MKSTSYKFLAGFSLVVAAGLGCDNPPVPACDRNHGGCDLNAVCVERTGGRVCICKPWYSGDGLTCAESGVQAGSPWPVEGGNVRHTGQSSYLGPQTNKVKWSADTGGLAGRGGPVIGADGTIYVGGPQNFYAYDPVPGQNGVGKIRWAHPVSSNDFEWSIAALGLDGTLYVQGGTTSQGDLWALDTANSPSSRVKWFYETAENRNAPNLGANGTVYAASLYTTTSSAGDGKLYAFTPAAVTSKEPEWTFDVGPVNGSSPAIGSGGTVFVATAFNSTSNVEGSLFAIGPDGTMRWSKLITGGAFLSSPIIGGDGTVYVGTELGYLYVFDPETGDSRSCKLAKEITVLALDAGSTLYVGTYEEGLFAVDPAKIGQEGCRPLWSVLLRISATSTGDSVDSIVIGADGLVYATSDRLYAVNPDGSIRWWSDEQLGPDMSPPAIGADGTLYVKDVKGVLYAFGQ